MMARCHLCDHHWDWVDTLFYRVKLLMRSDLIRILSEMRCTVHCWHCTQPQSFACPASPPVGPRGYLSGAADSQVTDFFHPPFRVAQTTAWIHDDSISRRINPFTYRLSLPRPRVPIVWAPV
jgi:hypothetical protein